MRQSLHATFDRNLSRPKPPEWLILLAFSYQLAAFDLGDVLCRAGGGSRIKCEIRRPRFQLLAGELGDVLCPWLQQVRPDRPAGPRDGPRGCRPVRARGPGRLPRSVARRRQAREGGPSRPGQHPRSRQARLLHVTGSKTLSESRG